MEPDMEQYEKASRLLMKLFIVMAAILCGFITWGVFGS